MFDQIKAKLGLDITDFQRGISGAQRGVGELAKSTTKGFTDLKNVGGTLATALGLNVQSIAESIARFVVGFSKDQEQALNDLVDATGRAADAQVAASKRAAQEREKIDKDIADKEEERRKSKLTDEERIAELSTRVGEIMTERAKLEKQGMQSSSIYARLKNEQLDAEKEISDLEKKGFDEADQRTEAIRRAEARLAKTRRDNSFKDASDAGKLLMLREDILKAEKAVTDAGTDQLRRNEALNALEEARTALKDEQARQSANVASSENKAADDVSDKIDNLFGRAAELDKVVKEAKRQAELPTMAEVAGRQRDIGTKPREDIKKLAAEEARIKKLSDNETRLKDQLAEAKTEGDRKNIIEEGRQNRAKLDAARARADALRKGLAGKVSDVPFAEQEAAAEAARKEAEAAAEAERNKPKPKPDGKPATPPSASEAASNAATGAIGKAQQNLTSTAPKPAAGGAGDIATNVSNCVKILGDIKDRLEPTSISTT